MTFRHKWFRFSRSANVLDDHACMCALFEVVLDGLVDAFRAICNLSAKARLISTVVAS